MLFIRSLLLLLVVHVALIGVGRSQEWVPFELQDNLIKVQAHLDGRPMEAVLDSGTGGLGIDKDFATSIGMELGSSIGMVPGGGKPEPMFPVTISRLDFGPEEIEHISAIALNLSNLSTSAGFPVKLLLGRPVFEDRAIRVDYSDRKIFFFPVGSQPSCADPLPLTFRGGVPVVTVNLKATSNSKPKQLHLIVDLGTRHFAAMIGGPFLETEDGQQLERSGRSTQVGTGTGGQVMGTAVSVADLSIGSKDYSGLTVALTRQVGSFGKNGVDGSLGVPLWESGSIIFDYPHKRFCLGAEK